MYFLQHPFATLLLIGGGSAVAAAAGLFRQARYSLALAFGTLAIVTLVGAGWMMVHTEDWGSADDEWGLAATDARQRLNLLLVAIGLLVLGAGAMWLGFGPVRLFSQVLFVIGGWLLLLCGVIGVVLWIRARKLFT